MPITEVIFPAFKPETAKEAFGVAKSAFPGLKSAAGLYDVRVGHMIRENGQDVSGQYRVIANLEWDKAESFHAVFPNAPLFQDFIKQIMPYAAAKATPRLFTPHEGYSRSKLSFESGVTQIFTGAVGHKKAEAQSAWDDLISTLKQEGEEIREWSGEGIEDFDGTWLTVLGWASVEKLDGLAKSGSVAKAFERLRSVPGMEEYSGVFETL